MAHSLYDTRLESKMMNKTTLIPSTRLPLTRMFMKGESSARKIENSNNTIFYVGLTVVLYVPKLSYHASSFFFVFT